MRTALLFVAVAVPALAHSWYPLACCGNTDCFPVACGAPSHRRFHAGTEDRARDRRTGRTRHGEPRPLALGFWFAMGRQALLLRSRNLLSLEPSCRRARRRQCQRAPRLSLRSSHSRLRAARSSLSGVIPRLRPPGFHLPLPHPRGDPAIAGLPAAGESGKHDIGLQFGADCDGALRRSPRHGPR